MEAATRLDPHSVTSGRAAPANMDREFIEKNQIVERYLSGRLPPRGASDFERFCRDNPELLDELGLPARVNAGLRLLEAGGKPEPWVEPPKKFWENPLVPLAATVLAVLLLVATIVLAVKLSGRDTQIAKLQKDVVAQPLEPMTSTRAIKLIPSRTGEPSSPSVTIGRPAVQLADLKIDMSWARFNAFRVTIEREGQGRVAILHNVLRDSNGMVRIAFNTSAVGPGTYQFEIEGLDWRGKPQKSAWTSIEIQH